MKLKTKEISRNTNRFSIPILSEKLGILYHQSFPAVFVSILTSMVLVATLWTHQKTVILLSWFALLSFSSFFRLILFFYYYRNSPSEKNIIKWEKPYFFSLLFSSLTWGIGGVFIMPPDSVTFEFVVYFFLIGMAGGALSVYTAIRKFALGAITCVLLPSTIYFLAKGNFTHLMISIGGFIFLGSAIRATKVLGETLHSNLYLKHTLSLSKQEIDNELEMARKIQYNLIPFRSLPKNIAGIFIPMNKIGGDFYDLIPIVSPKEKTRYGILIGDVSGHGIPAALITMMIKSFTYGQVRESREILMSPEMFLTSLSNHLVSGLNGNFISTLYAVYDPEARSIHYAGAGHPPPLLLSKKGYRFLNIKPQGIPIGIKINRINIPDFSSHYIKLKKNDRIFFYSDGLMDNADFEYSDKENLEEGFKKTILHDIFQNHNKLTIQQLMEETSLALLLKIAADPVDDICALVIEV